MAWLGLEGHDAIVKRFRRSIQSGRLASSYLFVGPSGIGKRSFALRLAQALLCERHSEAELNPCQQCPACQQVLAGSHPDVDYVSLPRGKTILPIELFVGERGHRSHEGFCHRMSLRPASGRRRVGIIDDADFFNQESANCLLKILEEPPRKSLLILIGTSLQRQLPTIRSRCQALHFQGLPHAFVKQYLLDKGLCPQPEEAERIAAMSEGSLDAAAAFADADLRRFCAELANQWAQTHPHTLAIAKQTQSFVEAAGTEAALRRERLRQVIRWMIVQLRQEVLNRVAHPDEPSDAGRRPPMEVAQRRIDRSLVALEQIDANANVATLIECWVDDLGQALWRPTSLIPDRSTARAAERATRSNR